MHYLFQQTNLNHRPSGYILKFFYLFSYYALLAIALPINVLASDNSQAPLHFYLDSDFSHHSESGRSIERGIHTALSEINHTIQGRKVELILTDNRANSKRAKQHMKRYLEDDNALVYYGGLHSPPLIKYREFINENGILVLASWSAGASITRHPEPNNSVFRLSVDDSKAGRFITNFATEKLSCQSPHLLLDSGPWGESNLHNMNKALKEKKISAQGITRFGWDIDQAGADSIVRAITNGDADCIYLVSTPFEGGVVSHAMRRQPQSKRIPIVSHWGITGGDFHKLMNYEQRQEIDLYFIQSCFSFNKKPLNDFQNTVFKQAQALYPDIVDTHSITAPVGFIHSYDITRLLINALNDITLSGNIIQDRRATKEALETLDTPIRGLIKTYQKPFSVYSEDNTDAHEALTIHDYCMAQYGQNDEILLID